MRAALVVLCCASIARADVPPKRAQRPVGSIAAAVSMPWYWPEGFIGASAYGRMTDRLAIRADFERWDYAPTVILGGADGPSYSGVMIDYGLGLVYFPRRLWSGLRLELGALVRDRDTLKVADQGLERTTTVSTIYAARGLIGWSWDVHPRVFLALAVGGARGYERGRDRVMAFEKPTTEAWVSRGYGSGEVYFRVGGVFGP
jgi:hypothetical protein